MPLYLQRKLTRFLNWILYYSDDINNVMTLYNDIREIKCRLKKMEEAEAKRTAQVWEKDKRIYGDHA